MHAINKETPAAPGLIEVTPTGTHGNAGRPFITNARRLAEARRASGSIVVSRAGG